MHKDDAQGIDDFKSSLYKMQDARRKLVASILNDCTIDPNLLSILKQSSDELMDARTNGELRQIQTKSTVFPVNIRDEINGFKKDAEFLSRLSAIGSGGGQIDNILEQVNLPEILAPFHPVSQEAFYNELDTTVGFLMDFVDSPNGIKPLFITDWDGTMKDYCAQYATNLQPVYSAITMGRFAATFTRAAAVLTAGPLRGPGILDLTALPINGPVIFSGSWGREWWLHGRRVVHDNDLSEEGFVAIGSLSDEMKELNEHGDFSQFALVGSGVQKKVDRLTLGVQTVFGQVPTELSSRYLDAIKERIHRVDPNNQFLALENASPLEVEVCIHSSGTVWNKANGVEALIKSLGDSLATGRVLVAGDTSSDLPMLQHAANENPQSVMALFVGASESLQNSVRAIVTDPARVCFVSVPDVAHAAFARVLAQKRELD